MARKRMIDPTLWADEDFSGLSPLAQVFYIGLISNADDEGRLPGNAVYLSSIIFPFKGLTPTEAKKVREEILNKMRSVILYIVDDKEYIQLKNWASYQSINKPTVSKYPPLPKDYRSPTVTLPPNRIEENRIEKKDARARGTSDALTRYLTLFNELFSRQYKPTLGRERKLQLRLKAFTIDQILEALENLARSEFHRGKNDRGWSADPDFLIGSDEKVDKWLNQTSDKPIQIKHPEDELTRLSRKIYGN